MLRIDKAFKRLSGIRVEVVANAPLERVFEFLADVPRYGEWLLPGTVEKTSAGAVGVGSTFTLTRFLRRFGRTRLEVTEFVVNERLAWEWGAMGSRQRVFLELQPADGATRVTYGEELLHLGLLNTLALVVVIPMIPLWIFLQWPVLGFVTGVSLTAWMVATVPAYALPARWRRRRCLRRIESRVTGP